MAPPTPICFCCNCVQLLGFCCNCGAILVQFWCNFAAILLQFCCNCSCDWARRATGLGRLKISNTYRYWPEAGWCDRAPPRTNQEGKNTRRKDAWRKLAQWPGRSDLAVSRFPIFQHRLSHALNVPFLEGIVKGFFEGWRGNWHNRWDEPLRGRATLINYLCAITCDLDRTKL
jgi:hypothetical protein